MISFGFVKRSALMAILSGQPRKAVVAKEKTRTRDVQVFAAYDVSQVDQASGVLLEVLAERERVKSVEGFDSKIDDEYTSGQLARAGLSYVLSSRGLRAHGANYWPWPRAMFKPTTPRRDLIKAIGLLVAEVERIDRLQ